MMWCDRTRTDLSLQRYPRHQNWLASPLRDGRIGQQYALVASHNLIPCAVSSGQGPLMSPISAIRCCVHLPTQRAGRLTGLAHESCHRPRGSVSRSARVPIQTWLSIQALLWNSAYPGSQISPMKRRVALLFTIFGARAVCPYDNVLFPSFMGGILHSLSQAAGLRSQASLSWQEIFS